MKRLKEEEIINFLKTHVKPLANSIYGDGYRASVTLIDGLILPCVTFRSPDNTIALAIKRFAEEKTGKSIFKYPSNDGYKKIVENFVTHGNCINIHDIASINQSNFAFPDAILKTIRRETKMGWTGFVAEMSDGKRFSFGTSFLFEFFNMPSGYLPENICQIINHSFLDNEGNLRSYNNADDFAIFKFEMVYRERPYFECFIHNL
jgi:hypothetical protein